MDRQTKEGERRYRTTGSYELKSGGSGAAIGAIARSGSGVLRHRAPPPPAPASGPPSARAPAKALPLTVPRPCGRTSYSPSPCLTSGTLRGNAGPLHLCTGGNQHKAQKENGLWFHLASAFPHLRSCDTTKENANSGRPSSSLTVRAVVVIFGGGPPFIKKKMR